jgi:hypothetical protein
MPGLVSATSGNKTVSSGRRLLAADQFPEEMAMSVDTSKVPNRRPLHFQTIDDILRDVEHLNGGKVKEIGNWSGGQILRHLATVMNGSIDGMSMRLPWYFRILGKMMKGRILNKGMTPGFQLKGAAAAELIPPATSWEEGLQKFRQALGRLHTETKREPSPFLGSMTREEWDQLHCRHAELHLSFLAPDHA